MVKWHKEVLGNSVSAQLAHGVGLRVWHEAFENVPEGAPAWNVSVFGRPLIGRSMSLEDGKARALATAKKRMLEALGEIEPVKVAA